MKGQSNVACIPLYKHKKWNNEYHNQNYTYNSKADKGTLGKVTFIVFMALNTEQTCHYTT